MPIGALLALSTLLACKTGGEVDTGLALLEDGEWLPGGEAGTNTLLGGSNSFIMPMPGLSDDDELLFYSGNSYFNQSWVEAPSSTEARDGLGPLFNARSCSGCHFKDGRAQPPEDGEAPFEGLLLRLSIDDEGTPDPVYGAQVQDNANPGHEPEMAPRITWEEVAGSYPDGTPYSLLSPTYHLEGAAYGDPDPSLLVSPRIAVQVVGLGLLEAIPTSRIEELADPDDEDGNGISGRVPWVVDPETGATVVGRFGWKGEAPTVPAQVAKALAEDLGLTSALVPADDCTEAQAGCLAATTGGDPEVSDDIFERIALYSRTLAVPARRAWEDEQVLRGKRLFDEVGCVGCHVPSHTTGDFGPIPELGGQLVWPYTDMLLHDLGSGLADGRPTGEASGQEWRTRPLWGVGLVPVVNGHTRYLNDGRARSVEEAILWHGGEAAGPRYGFTALSAEDRAALLAFLEDL